MFKYKNVIIFFLIIFIFSSCKFQKILKSTDYELKFEKAKEYYQEKDYIKATQLFDELLTIYKGSSKAEEVNYYYAECYYGNRDFILAANMPSNAFIKVQNVFIMIHRIIN